jgi:serine protease Do
MKNEEELKKENLLGDNSLAENLNDKKKLNIVSISKKALFLFAIILILLAAFFGGLFGILVNSQKYAQIFKSTNLNSKLNIGEKNTANLNNVAIEDSPIIKIAQDSSPAVVSIIVTKDVSRIQNTDPFGFGFPFGPFNGGDSSGSQKQQGTQKQEIGGGTGFFVSKDGMIVTNKHVVADSSATYTVVTTEGKEYPAKVLAQDPTQDIAIVKVEGTDFPILNLGDSDNLKTGQTVVAIGNSLGEFSNTVSRGIISGLKRNLTAGSDYSGQNERLTNIIQTDAAINPGNSGGPLIDINGSVIGVNVAMAQGAQNIGFALPINQVKKDIAQISQSGKISAPFLGVRYLPVDSVLQKENNLPFNYGVLVQRGQKLTDLAVIPGSPADKAGIVENDIILEINGEKINDTNQLSDLVAKNNIGDTINVKIWHKGETKDIKITLTERV